MCTRGATLPTPEGSLNSCFEVPPDDSFRGAAFQPSREVTAATRALRLLVDSSSISSAGASSSQIAREVVSIQTPKPRILIPSSAEYGFLRKLYSPDADRHPTPKFEQEHPLLSRLRQLGRKYQEILHDFERGISLEEQLHHVTAASMPHESSSGSNVGSAAGASSAAVSADRYGLDGRLVDDDSETFSEIEFWEQVEELTSRGKEISEIVVDLEEGLSLEEQLVLLLAKNSHR
jgi:hypothetical protein